MTAEAKSKAKFRTTSKWKNWRKYLKQKRKVDELTLKPLYKGFQVHHLDMSDKNYQLLEENRFVCLNRLSHDTVHFLFRYYKTDPDILKRLENILIKMCEYN